MTDEPSFHRRRALLVAGVWLGLAGLTSPFARAAPATLQVPTHGTPAQRIQKLWAKTRPLIQADLGADYSDAEYLRRGEPLWNAWLELEAQISSGDPDDLIADIVSLIEDLYGRDYIDAKHRAATRRHIKAERTEIMADLDVRVAAIK